MTDKQLLKQALEAKLQRLLREDGYLTNGQAWELAEKIATAIEATEKQEPFGFVSLHTNGDYHFSRFCSGVYRDTAKEITAVYTTPPAAPAQEPNIGALGMPVNVPVTPPASQRQWVDLTDEQIDDLYQGAGKNDLKRAREVIEAFKEKNT